MIIFPMVSTKHGQEITHKLFFHFNESKSKVSEVLQILLNNTDLIGGRTTEETMIGQ